ncbi:MAG: helix-turn-helix domain-containing protein [Robiginitomaculum sp.]|nr:helix-turn-helix domain-containing protein [Robiginitomaculum sp.]
MQRKYDYRRVKANRPYTVETLAELYGVKRTTVRDWIKKHGLANAIIDEKRPMLLKGVLIRLWMKDWQARRKSTCGEREIYCVACQRPQKIKPGTFRIHTSNTEKITVQGVCYGCNRTLNRFDVKANQAVLERHFSANHQMLEEALIEQNSKGLAPRNDYVQHRKNR